MKTGNKRIWIQWALVAGTAACLIAIASAIYFFPDTGAPSRFRWLLAHTVLRPGAEAMFWAGRFLNAEQRFALAHHFDFSIAAAAVLCDTFLGLVVGAFAGAIRTRLKTV